MSVLPLYIGIERPRPVFEPRLNHRDLLSDVVLPAILAAQRWGCHLPKNRHGASQDKTEADESRTKPQSGVSAVQRLSQEVEKPTTALVRSDANKFEVSLNVQEFSPEQVSVKTADGCIVVEGKHEEKHDEHGYITRQFVRRYALPEGCHPDTVESRLSSDGVLTVTAPKKQPALTGERTVPIMRTEPVGVTSSTSQQQRDVQR